MTNDNLPALRASTAVAVRQPTSTPTVQPMRLSTGLLVADLAGLLMAVVSLLAGRNVQATLIGVAVVAVLIAAIHERWKEVNS
ncbi:hypothetical protein QQG74_09455 [Micromonospora sp. FIMYZ51]|uniref:hypothetical protein n=1 Tax=Micromonospora sp. FIMYZ51 TaxID=3051832 RepID=UPI00311F8B5D